MVALGSMVGEARTYRNRRELIVPFWDRWDLVCGHLEWRNNPENTENFAEFELSLQVQYHELSGTHPNWEEQFREQFNHLTSRTLRITTNQVKSRADISEETLEKETGYGMNWPTLIFQCGPPDSEIYVEFQLDGFQTNMDSVRQEFMYEPYLGLLGSMIIEAGFLGLPIDDSKRVWKPNSLEKFKEPSDV